MYVLADGLYNDIHIYIYYMNAQYRSLDHSLMATAQKEYKIFCSVRLLSFGILPRMRRLVCAG